MTTVSSVSNVNPVDGSDHSSIHLYDVNFLLQEEQGRVNYWRAELKRHFNSEYGNSMCNALLSRAQETVSALNDFRAAGAEQVMTKHAVPRVQEERLTGNPESLLAVQLSKGWVKPVKSIHFDFA